MLSFDSEQFKLLNCVCLSKLFFASLLLNVKSSGSLDAIHYFLYVRAILLFSFLLALFPFSCPISIGLLSAFGYGFTNSGVAAPVLTCIEI